MPCNGGPYYTSYGPSEYEKTIDRLTQYLCYMCGYCEEKGVEVPDVIQEWFEEHVRKDKVRLEESFRKDIWKGKDWKKVVERRIRESEAVHPVSNFAKDLMRSIAATLAKEYEEETSTKRQALSKLTEEERKTLGLE